ncbi:MAG: hypothetical protein ABSG62_01770 [Terracidiphilus sp.]|jgi:hypothetical protein
MPNPMDFLNPINSAAQTTKSLVDIWANFKDRRDRENTSVAADLTALLEELRRTHSTIVKLVSPLRRISDNHQTFSNDFTAVYNDFRDVCDAYDFGEERTHCHKIWQIRSRLQKRKPHFGSDNQWLQLDGDLEALSNADIDLIDEQYKPFMRSFDAVMMAIKQSVDAGDIQEAIKAKNDFLNSLGAAYEQNKLMLEQMTDTVGRLTAGL